MKYAIIKTGGKQYKVTEGSVVEVELLTSTDNAYVFEEVLLVVDGDDVQLGTPTVSGMKVYAEVIGDIKGEKIEVFKYKSKSRYRKHTGHRQKYTQLKITGIGVKKASAVAKPKKAVETEIVAPVGAKDLSPVKPKVAKKTPAKKAASK